MRGRNKTRDVTLPDGVLLSAQGVSRAPPRPLPQPPRWLSRILPGVDWRPGPDRVDMSEEDDEFEDIGGQMGTAIPVKEISFDVAAGGGLGIVGPDPDATRSLMLLLAGFYPPTTGRIVIRGQVAPVFKQIDLNVTRQVGRKAVFLTARFLRWPTDLIRARWSEIEAFARNDEIREQAVGTYEHEVAQTKRLLLSTVLHLDATVYLVTGNFYETDPDFVMRCYDLLEQRQREGCAIIHSGEEVADVSRLCHEVIWLERGEALFRGRLGEVAKAVAERPVERSAAAAAAAMALPVRALLRGDDDDVRVGSGGGRVEIELDVFKQGLELALAMLFVDDDGRRTRVEQPEPFVADHPGVYRLSIAIPGGLLEDATYQARLLAAPANGSHGSTSPLELLSFEVVAGGSEAEAPAIGLDAAFGSEEDVEDADPHDVEWTVRPA